MDYEALLSHLSKAGGLGGLGGLGLSGIIGPDGPVARDADTPVPASQRARELTPSQAQRGLSDADFLAILQQAQGRSSERVQQVWDKFSGNPGSPPSDESARNIFTDLGQVAPINPLQEMQRYAQGAPSRVTDPEGRSGSPLFIAGTAPDGSGVPLNQGNIGALADTMAHLGTMNLPGSDWGGTAFRAGPDRPGMSNTAIGLNTGGVANGTAPSAVLAHEVGHTVHNFLGTQGNPLAGASPEAMKQFNSFGASRAAAEGASPTSPNSLSAYKYMMSPNENFAEGFRQYVTDPNGFKAQNPDAAAFLRKVINSNSSLKKLLMLSDVRSADRMTA